MDEVASQMSFGKAVSGLYGGILQAWRKYEHGNGRVL